MAKFESYAKLTNKQLKRLEKLRNHFCCFSIYSDCGCIWEIKGVLYETDPHTPQQLCGPTTYLGNAIDIVYKRFKAGKYESLKNS